MGGHGRPHYLTRFASRRPARGKLRAGRFDSVNGCHRPRYRRSGFARIVAAVATTYRMPKLSSRREYFRLPYPITAGAVLTVNGANYKVDELSERGLRVVTGVGRLPVDAIVQGTLTFAMGARCTVQGVILRVDDDSFIVKVDRGIKGYDVMREQAFVNKQFPDWKPQSA
jgi:hypothetical protein